MLIYFASFSQDLSVSNAEFDFKGDKIVLKMDINNISNHNVTDIDILIIYGDEEKSYTIEKLAPQEQYKFERELELTDALHYDVYVKTPYNLTKHFPIDFDETTIRPILASIFINSEMVVGTEYNPIVTFRNVSESDISDVQWITISEGDFFEEDFFPRTFSIKSGESKSLPTKLTPKMPGQVKLTFILKVGSIEYEQEQVITIKLAG